jgi:predicted  nucleic acid-binding Zn-ribbon protein
MTEEERILLNELKLNTDKLFHEFQNLEKEKERLEEKVTFLNKEIARIDKEKAELGRKNESLELANRILSGKDENHEARKRINKIVREIDKCIALLNK